MPNDDLGVLARAERCEDGPHEYGKPYDCAKIWPRFPWARVNCQSIYHNLIHEDCFEDWRLCVQHRATCPGWRTATEDEVDLNEVIIREQILLDIRAHGLYAARKMGYTGGWASGHATPKQAAISAVRAAMEAK